EGTWERLQSGDGTAPTEEIVAEGLDVAKAAIAEIIAFQREIVAQAGVTKADFVPRPLYSEETWSAVEYFAGPKLAAALVPEQRERVANLDALKNDLKAHALSAWGEETYAERASEIGPAFKDLQKKAMRKKIVEEGVRLDGRRS